MPDQSELPPDLQRLTEFNALKLRDGDWQHDLDAICRTLEGIGFKPVSSGAQTPQSEDPLQAPARKKGPNVKAIIGAAMMVSVLLGFLFGLGRSRGSDVPVSNAGGPTSVQLLGGHAVVRYDPEIWRPDNTPLTPGNFQWVHATGRVFFSVTSQPFQVGPEDLATNGFMTLQRFDPKSTITRRGSRRVNGLDMIIREFEATDKDIPLTYYAHYYSDTSGSVALVGWTYRPLIDDSRRTIEQFVAGFDVTAKK